MQDHLRVAAGLEDRPVAHELVPQLPRVDQVTVVCDGNLTVCAVDQKRLSVFELAFARRRVARVADRQMARQLLECGLVECFGHLPHRARCTNPGTVGRNDPGTLLAAMLESVEAEVREVGSLGMPEDPEDAALVLELVEHWVRRPSPGSAKPILRCPSPIMSGEMRSD